MGFEAFTKNKRQYQGKETVRFERVSYNIGGGYSKTDYTFTAPLAGKYLFIYFFSSIDNQEVELYLQVAGMLGGYKVWSYPGASSAVVYLKEGNKVWLETSGELGITSVVSNKATFFGMLINAD